MPPANLDPASALLPSFFKCPISLELMRDPVSLCTGVSYDRPSIEAWFDQGHNTCPATMRCLDDRRLTPNHTLRRLIQQWCVANPSYGIQRIPTPKAVLEPQQVRVLSTTISGSSSSPAEKLHALQRLRSFSKDSESSKRCIRTNLTADVLVDLIRTEARSSSPDIEIVQESIGLLNLLTIDTQHKQIMLDPAQLRMVARVLARGSLDVRATAAQLVEVLSEERQGKARVGQEDDIIEGLIDLLRQNNVITDQVALKASLKALLSLCQTLNNRVRVVQFKQESVVNALVELLPGADRGLVERVVAVLDTLSLCAEGRAAISAHALAVPSVIRSLLSVSEAATEHAISVLWSVCINSSEEELLEEALQLGVLKKLLLVVQMTDFNPRTTQKAKDLLRLFSNFSDKHCSSEEI